MGFELVMRFRCEVCLQAYEVMQLPEKVPAFPIGFSQKVPSLPPGWTRNGDAVFCPPHEQSPIKVVGAIPGLRGLN